MNTEELLNKKILMFGPSFFGYCDIIAEELRALGAQVDLYDERPNNGAFCKIMLRYDVKLYRSAVKKYYLSVIEQNRDKEYDYIFVIKSEAINEDIFGCLKAAFPKAKCILYLWDSVENVPGGKEKIRLYDRVLTFDDVDAKEYGLIFRPLFYRKEYEASCEKKTEYTYMVAFIGTAHTVRPRVVNQLEAQCEKIGGKCFKYLFLPHPIVFLYNKLLNRAYRNVKKSDINFKSISPAEINKVYSDSLCILDVEHQAQRGLTMRTIEMIGMQKKLITTNKGIGKYDFYNEDNICIIDKDEPLVPHEFWTSEYKPLESDILKKYSLRAFVQDIFDIKR